MEKDKLELLLSWVTAMLFTAGGVVIIKFVNEAAGYSIIAIGITILSTCLGLNLVFNSIPHWKLSVAERKETLAIRTKQFAQKESFIKTITTSPSEEDKKEISSFIEQVKESPLAKKIVAGLEELKKTPLE